LGPRGNLAVPAFNFAFARGEPFDPHLTASQGMGVFAEYIRQHPKARRTPHPMQSLAVLGPHAADLVQRDTPAAFDPGSAFERLLELDYKLLLLGADIQSVSMTHYSEQRANVPYRFWKDFQGKVFKAGSWESCIYRMFVRDLEIDPRLDLRPVKTLLQSRNQWSSAALNYGQVSLCRLADFVSAADHLLSTDVWSLVGNRLEALARYHERENRSQSERREFL
jgi:aminoglycoside 3-N-acetyltransferase